MSKHLTSGYTFEPLYGAPYHFEHIPRDEAEDLASFKESFFIVETINWTHGDGDETLAHHNRYFAHGLAEALGLAVRIEMDSREVAEEVVGLWPASEEEWEECHRAFDLFVTGKPRAVERLPGTKKGKGKK